MFFKLLILFVTVKISEGGFNRESWRSQDNDHNSKYRYNYYDNNRNNEDTEVNFYRRGNSKDYQSQYRRDFTTPENQYLYDYTTNKYSNTDINHNIQNNYGGNENNFRGYNNENLNRDYRKKSNNNDNINENKIYFTNDVYKNQDSRRYNTQENRKGRQQNLQGNKNFQNNNHNNNINNRDEYERDQQGLNKNKSQPIKFENEYQSSTSYKKPEVSVLSNNKNEEPKKEEGNTNKKQPGPKRRLIPEDKCGLDVPRRIIGGTSTDIDEFPWMGLIQYVDTSGKVSHDCGGVLISKRYILTAAHCTKGPALKNRQVRRVRLGEWDISTDKDCQGDVCSPKFQDMEIEKIIPHEDYKPKDKSQVNDIALIRFKSNANFNQYVQPICLPFDNIGVRNYEGKKLTVSGWGKTSNSRNSASNIKMKVDLPVVGWNQCRDFYKSFYGDVQIKESQFCAGGEEGQDSCRGDSGGPLMSAERTYSEIKWYVIGIVSSGPAACGMEGRPSLYTNVSQFTRWILDNIEA